MRRRRASRGRLLLALLVAAALHVVLIATLGPFISERAAPPRRTYVVRHLSPPLLQETPAVADAPAPPERSVAPPPEPHAEASVPEPASPDTAAPEAERAQVQPAQAERDQAEGAQAEPDQAEPDQAESDQAESVQAGHAQGDRSSTTRGGPRRVDFFPPTAVHGGATPPSGDEEAEEDGAARARRRLASWDDAMARRAKLQALRIEPGVGDLGTRLHGVFSPPESVAENAGVKPVSWTAVLPSSPLLEKIITGHTDGGSTAPRAWEMTADLLADARAVQGGPTGPGESGVLALPLLCFGACGQSHEALELHAIIEVDHDELGIPMRSRLLRSSGDGGLDNAALEAVAAVREWASPDALKGGAPAQLTRWMFSAHAYRWSRVELLLDPQFTPPGKELEHTSTWAGKTTMTTSIRLVAVVYRGG